MPANGFRITGTGSALPEYQLTNEQLSHMVDTSDEWITSRTGIRRRRICTTESMTDLSVQAAGQALAQAGVAAGELDLILCATMQGDNVTPSMGCMVQQRIGAACPAFDVNAACTGFVYALDVAAGYFARGHVQKVLLIASERLSKHIDWSDRATCVLFGDGAGAVVLAEGENPLAILLSAAGSEHLLIPGAAGAFPGARPVAGGHTLRMNGQEVYKFAVGSIYVNIEKVLSAAGVTSQAVRYFLLHQANQRILDAAVERLNVEQDKVISTIGRYGNTSSASIPIMLDELHRQGGIQPGDLLVFCAFGGGLTTGTALLRW